ncbi:hypothetical protein DW088_01555 [Butyricicoccus sp. AM05-1]|uniref:hypothetical protein n=1 Tax=Butyricicoccus sp. AM05-1 TaxID=2292004 RepID=UPI000E4D0C60|nr:MULTISPECIES: hypothetical protein [unclassified Butyricicoccus]RHO64917.1 hypothetical protein DW088_01555 [Butyricicoccus sp. AM05-1]
MANTTSALIQNWSTVEDVIESTKNATGSADAENAKYLDSIQGKLAQFQAQFQSASTSVLDSGFVKGTIDAGSGILGFFNTLIDKLGVLPGLITPVASLLLSMNGKSIIGGKGESGENTLDGSGLFSWLKNYNTKNHDYWKEQNDILKSYAQMKQKLRGADFEKALSGATIQSREFAKSLDTVGNEYDVVTGQIDNFTAKQEKIGTLGAKITSTFKGIGSAIASMAVSMAAVMAIQIAITGIATVIDKAIMSAKEASEVTGTVLSNYSKATSEIDNNLSSVDNMRERFEELSKGVTESGKNVSLSAEQYQEYQDMVSQLVSINPALIQGYNDEQQAIINKNEAIQQTIDLLKQQRIQEANETVYGGSSTNDGHKQNYEAAYIDMEGQIDQANQELDNAKGGIASFLKKAYKEAAEAGTGEASKFQKILESAAGQTFNEYADYWKAKGSKKVGMDGFILGNSDKFGDNIQDIINQLNDANLLSKDLASEGVNVERTWSAAMDTYDNASGSLKQVMQAALEANAQYYDLSQSQQAFLSDYVSGIDTSMLKGKGEKAALNYANAMMKVVTETDAGKNAIDSYYKLLDKRDSMPFDQFEGQATQLFDIIRAQLSNYLTDNEMASVDLSKIFGLTQFEEDMKQMREAIRSNFTEALSGAEFDGTSLEALLNGLDLEKLSKNQLSALNSALIDTGERASEFAVRLATLAQAGALPEALDAISKSLDTQAESLNTVSGALTEYETSMEGVTDHVQDHESMVSIYDDFAESVNKGQINTEEARNQMELLIGKVVSLKEAKQWVKDNEGLFLTGTDEDNVGQDLTGTLNTLHKKYNELSADKKKAVDGLMDVDWNTGSMQVAQHDVVALADAFGISAASLQQSLDLISTYSDYVPKTVGSVVSSIQTLNNETYRIKQSVNEADQSTTKAWEHMSSSAKVALESLTEGMDIDVKNMSVTELDSLVAAMNRFKASIGGDTPTFDGLKASLESVKTASGEAAASVERLSDGGWSINVTNLDAFAGSLGVTNEQAQIVLNTLAKIQDESGNPVQLTIEGNTVEAEQKGNAIDEALAPIERERGIKIETANANRAINSLKVTLDSTLGHLSYAINFTTGSVPKAPVYSGSNSYPSATGSPRRNPKQFYTGHVGKMAQYASGGNAIGGKTLVGELGPEQWISRDGKHSKFVGLHGMEVINTKPGDAIVPANLTAGLMHGGIPHQAYNTWGGVSASNPLSNLNYGTGGKFRNWTSSSSSKKSNATVKVSADTSQLSDSAKEALDKIKEEVEDIIDQIEHKIYLVEKQRGDPMQIVAYYKQIQNEAKKAADRFRAQGQKDSSEYVRSQQKTWWEAHDSIIDTMKDMYDKITSEHENAVKLAERSLDRLLDTDKLERSFTRAQRKIFNSAKLSQNILNGVAKKGNPLAGIFGGIADSFETKTVDTIFSSIDGDAIESTLNGIIDHYREAQKNLHKEAQYYRGMGYSDLSDEVADLSDQWWEYEDAVKDVKQKVIDYLSDIVDAASDSVDTIQDVLDTFKKAAEEYSTNGGFISVDTFQEISKLGVEYMGYLKDENGLLTINEEMINRVIKAKTEQMALESASAYVERLRLALQENDVVSLNNLLNATADLTEVQWGSVYAQLAMLDLTEEGYAQAVKNVDAYRSILANVKDGTGVDFDDMKSGVDDLLGYVEDMIKDKIDKQVDALEDLKDKYAEIIDLKKESLQLTKDENDYQEDVADKVKELAKIQEKLNALSLDDSRESIAKRKELEEQMADLQKELQNSQADYAYDKQTENLDKLQEAYEKQKDEEIKKLQDSISSQEKLYRQARDYIEKNWSTLYDELIEWNTESGSVINKQICSAWDNALEAAKRYGSYLAALDAIGTDGSGSSSSGSNSNIIGNSNKYGTGDADVAGIARIVAKMKKNSDTWSANMTAEQKKALNQKNADYAGQLNSQYDLGVHYDGHTGVWYDKYGNNIYDKYLGIYHTGGVVGDASTLRQDEMVAILQKGEIVLDKPKQQSLDSILKVMSAITSGLSASALPDLSKTAQMPVSGVNREVVTIPRENVTNVTFGDTIIKGADGDTVKQHEAVSRRMVNDIIEVLKIKK